MKGLALLAALALVTAVTAVAGAAASLGVTTAKLTLSTKALTHGSCTLGATTTSDASVREDSATSNFGTSPTLDVQSNTNKRRYSFIKFDTTSCNFPSGAAVDSAILTLTLTNAPTSQRTYDVYRVMGSWTESGITWNTQPTVAAAATTSVTIPVTNGAISITLTADSAQFRDGTVTDNGWRISDSGAGNASGQFASSENATAANRPSLTITYAS